MAVSVMKHTPKVSKTLQRKIQIFENGLMSLLYKEDFRVLT